MLVLQRELVPVSYTHLFTVFLKASESTEAFGVEEVFDFDEDREKKRRAAFEEREAAQEEAGHGD